MIRDAKQQKGPNCRHFSSHAHFCSLKWFTSWSKRITNKPLVKLLCNFLLPFRSCLTALWLKIFVSNDSKHLDPTNLTQFLGQLDTSGLWSSNCLGEGPYQAQTATCRYRDSPNMRDQSATKQEKMYIWPLLGYVICNFAK